MEGVSLTTGLAARRDDVRALHHPVAGSRGGVKRVSLSDALALGSAVWDGLLGRGRSPSPFMSWAWHRAWADSAPSEEVGASEALLLHGPDGSLEALLPVRLSRVRFHRVWVQALTWAIGDVGCPDDLDVPALPEADLSALAAALETLPWQVLILSNLVAGAANADRLCAALVRRGHVARQRALCPCPELELPASWDAYLATLRRSRRQALRYMERSLRRHHAVALTDYDEDRLEEGWRCLLSLHETRWDGGGAFQDPRSQGLQRRFAREMAKRKRLWLTTLDLDGRPAPGLPGPSAGGGERPVVERNRGAPRRAERRLVPRRIRRLHAEAGGRRSYQAV